MHGITEAERISVPTKLGVKSSGFSADQLTVYENHANVLFCKSVDRRDLKLALTQESPGCGKVHLIQQRKMFV